MNGAPQLLWDPWAGTIGVPTPVITPPTGGGGGVCETGIDPSTGECIGNLPGGGGLPTDCPFGANPQPSDTGPGTVYQPNPGGGVLGAPVISQASAKCWHPASNQNQVPSIYSELESFNSYAEAAAKYGPLCLCTTEIIPPPVSGSCQPPCPPPGTSCDNPLWIKTCPPETKPPTQSGGGQTGGVGGATEPGQPAAGTLQDCKGLDDFMAATGGMGPDEILASMGLEPDDNGQFPAVANVLGDYADVPVIGGLLAWGVAAVMSVTTLVQKAWVSTQINILQYSCSAVGSLVQLASYRASLTWMRRLLGMETRVVEQRIENAEKYICPSRVPSIAEANLALRTGDIDQQTWRCWVRMNDVDEANEAPVYNALRQQLSPEQLIILWRRGQLGDGELQTLLGQAGMISIDDQIRLDQVTQFYPPVTDLLQFTVRAIADQEMVERFGLLEEFDELYQGQIRSWGEANGISKDVMKAYIAAHWAVPAPGQLMQMMIRLRPDNVPPGLDPGDWVTTSEDVDRGLREATYAPFWRDRLKAIAYNPAPLRQIIQAFIRGAADEDEVKFALTDNAYSPTTVLSMVEWIKVQRRDHIRGNAITKLYMENAVNRDEASQRLQEEGYFEEEVSGVLDWAATEADDLSRKACLSGMKKGFDCGSCDTTGLQDQLVQLGLDPDQLQRMLSQWECQKRTTPKQVPASQLCSWADSGLITPQEHYQRLRNLGYDDNDATRIVAECNIKLSEKQLAERARQLRQAVRDKQLSINRTDADQRRLLAEARREANLATRLQREQQAALAKADREKLRQIGLAERKAAQGKRLAISAGAKARAAELRLGRAAVAWAEIKNIDPALAGEQVKAAVIAATAAGDGSEERGIQATILAVLAAKKISVDDLTVAARDQAQTLLDYAEIASVAVCEADSLNCPTASSSGDTSAPVATNGVGEHPAAGEPLNSGGGSSGKSGI